MSGGRVKRGKMVKGVYVHIMHNALRHAVQSSTMQIMTCFHSNTTTAHRYVSEHAMIMFLGLLYISRTPLGQ